MRLCLELAQFFGVTGIGFGVEKLFLYTNISGGKIVLHCPKMSVTIVGKALQIICLNEDEVMIEGYIEHIEYR